MYVETQVTARALMVLGTGGSEQYRGLTAAGVMADATDAFIGIALEAGAAGATVPVALGGVVPAVASADVAMGESLIAATGGKVAPYVDTGPIVGVALGAGAADSIIHIKLLP